MDETPPQPRTPFAELRVPPPSLARPTRVPAIRSVLKIGILITFFTAFSAGSCGLVAGGMHGLAFAGLFFTAMGVLGMGLSLPVAVALDSSRAMRKGLGPTVASDVLERGAGQLAVTGPSDGSLGIPSGAQS